MCNEKKKQPFSFIVQSRGCSNNFALSIPTRQSINQQATESFPSSLSLYFSLFLSFPILFRINIPL